jgi:hypothetical protein
MSFVTASAVVITATAEIVPAPVIAVAALVIPASVSPAPSVSVLPVPTVIEVTSLSLVAAPDRLTVEPVPIVSVFRLSQVFVPPAAVASWIKVGTGGVCLERYDVSMKPIYFTPFFESSIFFFTKR